MSYKGKFTTFKNPDKYIGDKENVIYRSLWERNVMRWLDENSNIIEWGSEELTVMYEHPVRGGVAKYYPDFIIKDKTNQVTVIEVKPEIQTHRPVAPSRQTPKYLKEVMTYAINQEKWSTAKRYCRRNGIKFEVWTEKKLKELGILSWETDKSVLMAESKDSKKPKMKKVSYKKPNRPKRKS